MQPIATHVQKTVERSSSSTSRRRTSREATAAPASAGSKATITSTIPATPYETGDSNRARTMPTTTFDDSKTIRVAVFQASPRSTGLRNDSTAAGAVTASTRPTIGSGPGGGTCPFG